MKKLRINKNISFKGSFILLAIPPVVLVLESCGLAPDGNRARYTHDEIPNYNYESKETINSKIEDVDLDNLIIPLQDIGVNDLTSVRLNYTNTNNENFQLYLNNLNTVYNYESIYNFDNSLKEYNKLKFTNSHKLKLKELDSELLYKIIQKNNETYKKNNNSVIFKELSDSNTKKISNIIIKTVKDFVKSNDDISIDRIKCVLSDLKLFKSSSMCNAFVTNDNCLVISPNMLKFANTINGKGTEEDVLKHEIMHLLQKGCNCDLELNNNLKKNFGISYGFQDIEINSLDFSWLYEASAEKNMVNYTGHKPLVYKNMIGYLESLNIVNLLNDNYDVNDAEELSFKRSLDDLYGYFGITTEKNKKEILNMMYSIEVMQQAPDAFYELLEKATGKKKDNVLIDEVNYDVKNSVCETLTKLFYRNLSTQISNKNVSLGDVFYLISIFENDLNSHIFYDRIQKYDYNEKIMNNYVEIQDNFFLELSKSINCTQEEIENLYISYTDTINQGGKLKKNYSLSFLDKTKIDYLEKRELDINKVAAPTIREVLNKYLNNNIKKVYN